MNLQSRIELLEAVVDSWRLPPEPPWDELRKDAEMMSLPLARVVQIWKNAIATSPGGLYGTALLCYMHDLDDAKKELAVTGSEGSLAP